MKVLTNRITQNLHFLRKTDCNLLFDKPLMFIPIQRVVISKFLKAILNALQDMSGALTIREGKAM